MRQARRRSLMMARPRSSPTIPSIRPDLSVEERLVRVLQGNLDFHEQDSRYSSHNFHSFPAKFPPQLPRVFIESLTIPGEAVLDPMVGSGTAVLEALLSGRRAIGTDIDPLALLISAVKTTPLSPIAAIRASRSVVQRAYARIEALGRDSLPGVSAEWDEETRAFVNYWFAPDTQRELSALIQEIRLVDEPALRAFLLVAFSATIITKSGGVSLAYDLGHTRPHRAKAAYTKDGELIYRAEKHLSSESRVARFTKRLRSPLQEFTRRAEINASGLIQPSQAAPSAAISRADCQSLPYLGSSVDLIVTSPPYASNAIDYMRAHKFSLVWMGRAIRELGLSRGKYIGGESSSRVTYEPMPSLAASTMDALRVRDPRKSVVLHRYFSEMRRVLTEMHRVLKPGKAAILVVGTSQMRGVDTKTHECLSEIAKTVGFRVAGIAERHLDRDRRMLPSSASANSGSQIEQRMHSEYVLGFYKPNSP
ncbi:MAG TPA: DNA methyltransferase [Anaerolineales bacterium]|nr:DNA methyltransferase [Anaerolineales bacterium]